MQTKLIGAVGAVTAACVITWGGNAHAEILITTATISQGELVIVGRVRRLREPDVEIKISPSKTVQVKGTATGGFRWIGPEFPSTCIVKITSGPDTRDVVIQNCGLPGPATCWIARARRPSGASWARRPGGLGRTEGRSWRDR